MTKMVKLAICLAFIALLSQAQSKSILQHKDAFAKSEREFSISFMKTLHKHSPHQTHIFSPHSMFHALTLVQLAAGERMEQSMAQALNLQWANNKDDVYAAYKSENEDRQNRNYQSTEFNSVDRVYVSKETVVDESFEKRFADILGVLDFAGDTEGSREHINHFVEEVTKNHIPELLQPGVITPLTKSILANAAYFHSEWLNAFNVKHTRKMEFIGTQKTAQVDMMEQENDFNYGYIKELQASYVELPYNEQDESVSLFVFLPSKSSSIDYLVEHITADVFDKMAGKGYKSDLTVMLPKMNFSQRYEFTDVLSDMGFDQMFSSAADFSGLTKTSRLSVEDVVHMAKIQIDEKGTTAAAATGISMRLTSMPATFICNRPFVFMVYEKHLGQVLFTGLYTNPQ